jgi:thiol-disulfide isomerase/thioredoxin
MTFRSGLIRGGIFVLGLVIVIVLLSARFSEQFRKTSVQDKLNTNIGEPAPEIVMADTSGRKILRLSEHKGYYVLLDFWASWCAPCRRENPFVVAAWQQFRNKKFQKAKGFRIFSVSLDNNALSWKKAIVDDKLDWPWHVSDLQGWKNAAARIYGVNKIPSNFLLDPKGLIIAQNLRGPALEQELRKYLKP